VRFLVVAVGDRMPAWVDAAFADYARRMPRRARLELVAIKPEPRTTGRSPQQMMAAEAARIRAAIPSGCALVALDERGRDLTTRELAGQVEKWLAGGADVAFLIGGPDGLDAGLRAAAGARLRLSSLTLPHAMVRVLLAEQLYRALSILDNHPYHRE
jgi:23S rRNA (pseudouridine1915-N3)-methyltransferase